MAPTIPDCFAPRNALRRAPAGRLRPPHQPPQGYAQLPSDAVEGAGDPTRAAILNAAYAFGNPASLAGRPAQAARAVANYAFLPTELPYGPRWRGFNGRLSRPSWRLRACGNCRPAFGIAPNAPTQAVVDGLYGASRALRAGDQRGRGAHPVAAGLHPGGAATVQRLAAMPLLPRAAAGANAGRAGDGPAGPARLAARHDGGGGGGSGRP